MRALILLLSVFCLAKGQPEFDQKGRDHDGDDNDFHRCPSNQRWLQCGPPCGDRQCPRQFDEAFKCDPRHKCGKSGCYCLRDFVRDSNNRCIPEDKCPPQCHDRNEQVDQCGNRCESKCPRSMEEAGRPEPCPMICDSPACACKPGFYRSPNGGCVVLEHCPNICSRNEFWNSCGRACEDTCRRFNSGEPNRCPAICERKGACQCKNGLYRNAEGKCVPPGQCLVCHGRNEQVAECPPPMECRPHCDKDKFDSRCFHNLNHNCRAACVCKHGYVRRWDGACVRRENCFDHRPQ